MRIDRRADRHDEANSFFQFCKCAKKCSKRIICSTIPIKMCEILVTVRVPSPSPLPYPLFGLCGIFIYTNPSIRIYHILKYVYPAWSFVCDALYPNAMHPYTLTASVESVFVSSSPFHHVFLVAFSRHYV